MHSLWTAVLVCCVAGQALAAGLSQVIVRSTNGGADANAHTTVVVRPPGQPRREIAHGRGGSAIRVAPGTYDIEVIFSEGAARKSVFLTGEQVTTTLDRDVDVQLPLARLKLVITNGGLPAPDRTSFVVYPAGKRRAELTHARGSSSVVVPAGTYDIRVEYRDGAARRETWIEGRRLEGTVEETVEIGLAACQLKLVITNGGRPVPDKSTFVIYPAGQRRTEVTHARGSATVTVPAGTYDIRVEFRDQAAHRDIWLEGRHLEGRIEETVEIGLATCPLKVTITNGGQPVPDQSNFVVHPAGQRGSEIAHARGSATVIVPAGVYDIQASFRDGAAHAEKWIKARRCDGPVNEEVEIALPLCHFKLILTNDGVPVPDKADFVIYPGGDHHAEITHARGSATAVVPDGVYDILVRFRDGSFRHDRWLSGEKLEGRIERTLELGLKMARLKTTILRQGQDVKQKGWFGVYAPGDHATLLDRGSSGATLVLAAGRYDIQAVYQDGEGRAEKWLEGVPVEGLVAKTVELTVPFGRLRCRVTCQGAEVGDKGWWGLFQPGERAEENRIVQARSGQTLEVVEGRYDVGAFYTDGRVRLSGWLPQVDIKGDEERTIELGGAQADIGVRVTRQHRPLPGAWWGLFSPGDTAQPVATAQSGERLKTLAGTYDIGAFVTEDGTTTEAWLKGQKLSGTGEREIELAAPAASLTIRSRREETSGPGGAARPAPNVELILDASGSMWSRLEGSTRMEEAREVLQDVIKRLPGEGLNVGLWVYGTQPKARHDCEDVRQLVPLGPVDKPALAAALARVQPSGWTPIAKALERVGAELRPGADNAIVLVTDGIESCDGDPCATVRALAARGIAVRSFVVGFGLAQDKGRFLSCIGRYFPAANRSELQAALKQVLAESTRPISGTVVIRRAGSTDQVEASGGLDQKLVVPAGRHDVDITVGGRSIRWPGISLSGDLVADPSDAPPPAH